MRVTVEILNSNGAHSRTLINRQLVFLDAGSRLPWEKDVVLDVDVSGLASGTYQMKPMCHRLSLTGIDPRLTLQAMCDRLAFLPPALTAEFLSPC